MSKPESFNPRKLELVNRIMDRIETLKKPQCLDVVLEINEEAREELYEKLPTLDRNKILSTFYKCYDDTDAPKYNFVCISNKHRKSEIRKLEDRLGKFYQ